MCAESETTIRGKYVNIFLGYCGCRISIEEYEFSCFSTAEERKEYVNFMCQFDKEEIINMILDLVKIAKER